MRPTLYTTSLVVLLLYAGVDGKLVSLHKTVTMSSVSNSMTTGDGLGYHMVDGDTRRNTTGCKCCSATEHTAFTNYLTPWYILDLGKEFVIEEIKILGRLPGGGDYQNIGNVTISVMNSTGKAVFSAQTPNEAIFTYNVTLPQPVTGQKIQLQKTYGQGHFTICELSVYGECVDGEFGDGNDCNGTCHCRNTTVPCDKTIGTCPPGGCLTGYQGSACDTECHNNKYGVDCASNCGHCSGGVTCHHVNGTCSSCSPGYRTEYCNQTCDAGTYGQKCSNPCGHCLDDDCPPEDGRCRKGCDAGFKGDTCHTECANRTFGVNCTGLCYCKDGVPCNKSTGACPGECAPGYQGNTCNVVCSGRSYGQNCGSTCGHCTGGAPCNHVTGTCTSCDPGYLTEYCNQSCGHGRFGQNCGQTCGQCKDMVTCDIGNGTCSDGCDRGYKGTLCKQPCTDKTYGYNCDKACGRCRDDGPCDTKDGSCPSGCEPGYASDRCDQNCTSGYFGEGCNSTCGNCTDGATCDHINGTCTSCVPGYMTVFCNQTCTPGQYGVDCGMNCSGNCVNGTQCMFTTGTCDEGCTDGYTGDTCLIDITNQQGGGQTDEPGSSVGPIVGAVVGVVVIAAVVIVIVVLVIRRRRNQQEGGGKQPGFSSVITGEPDRRPNGPASGIPQYAQVIKKPGGGVGMKVEDTHVAKSELNGKEPSPTGGDIRGVTKANAGAGQGYKPDTNGKDTRPKSVQLKDILKPKKKGDKSSLQKDTAGPSNFDEFPPLLKICQLWDYINENKRDGFVKLSQEFGCIKTSFLHPNEAAQNNQSKNRYKGICAYDHNRVTLAVERPKESEYINASYINGYKKSRKFIASQGPVDKMVDDFWRMIWQYDCKQIVMLTNLMEMGNEKCIQYWPETGQLVFGQVTIQAGSVTTTTDFAIRQFDLFKNGQGPKTVTQYHFKAWPDKDIPDSTWSLVNFWLKVIHDGDKGDTPCVVHCSAGVGRTGTYIAMDYLYNQGKLEGALAPLQAVQKLRDQRPCMVQTKEQYVFLHEVVADALLFGTHFIYSNQLEDVYNYLKQTDPGTSSTRLQTQYQIVVASIKPKKKQSEIIEEEAEYSNVQESEYSNVAFNNDSAIYENKVLNHKGSPLFGSELVPDYKGRLSLVLSTSPTKGTMEPWWRFIQERNIKIVVMVTDSSSPDYQECKTLGTTDKRLQESVKVSLTEEKNYTAFTRREFKFSTPLKSGSNSSLYQLEYTKWTDGQGIPQDQQSMVNLLDHVTELQDRLSEQEPILIHCTSGSLRSGLVASLLTEFYRLKNDGGHINIVETVKLLKEKHGATIPTFEQYQYIYDAMFHKVCGGEVYANL